MGSPKTPEGSGPGRVRVGDTKRPESVLVVVYTQTGKVLLIRRADHPCFWQSITGSMRWDESTPLQAASRELREETGLVPIYPLRDLGMTFRYPILPSWRHRYALGTVENVEHVFALALPVESDITINPAEHVEYAWAPFSEAPERVSSWTNREVILGIGAILQESEAVDGGCGVGLRTIRQPF